MSQLDVQNILQGLAQGQARRAAGLQASMEQQRLDNMREFQQNEVKNKQDELKQQHDHFLAELDLQKTAAKVLHLRAQKELETGDLDRMVRGQPIAGAQPVGTGIMAPGMQMQQVPSFNPDTGDSTTKTITGPTPEAFAQKQADLQQVTNQPAIAAKIAEAQAAQAAEGERFQKQLQMQRDTAEMVARINQSGENARNAATNTSAENRALWAQGLNLPSNVDGGVISEVHKHILAALTDGSMTAEELKAQYPAGMTHQILQEATSLGIRPLTKDKATLLQQVAPLVSKFPDYIHLLETQRTAPGGALGQKLLGGLTNNGGLNPEFAQAHKQLADTNATFAKAFAGAQRGANVQEIRSQEGFMPSANSPVAQNAEGVGTLISDYLNFVNNGLADGMSPQQKAALNTRLGLDKWTGVAESLKKGIIPDPQKMGLQPTAPQTAAGPKILSIEPVQ